MASSSTPAAAAPTGPVIPRRKPGHFPPAGGTTLTTLYPLRGAGMTAVPLNAFLRRLYRGLAATALGEQSDRQLAERFLADHDPASFEAIVRRHGSMVYRV